MVEVHEEEDREECVGRVARHLPRRLAAVRPGVEQSRERKGRKHRRPRQRVQFAAAQGRKQAALRERMARARGAPVRKVHIEVQGLRRVAGQGHENVAGARHRKDAQDSTLGIDGHGLCGPGPHPRLAPSWQRHTHIVRSCVHHVVGHNEE